jgi:MT-A70
METFHRGTTRDKIGSFAGVSGRTVEKIAAVVDAAKAEPERFGKLLADMDRTGRVNGIFRRLKIIKQGDAIRAEPPPLPGNGPYRVIVADPPWPYEKRAEDPSRRGVLPYATMSIAEIKAMDVVSIAHEDCLLWLSTTNHHMREAFDVLNAWGFEQKTILTHGPRIAWVMVIGCAARPNTVCSPLAASRPSCLQIKPHCCTARFVGIRKSQKSSTRWSKGCVQPRAMPNYSRAVRGQIGTGMGMRCCR